MATSTGSVSAVSAEQKYVLFQSSAEGVRMNLQHTVVQKIIGPLLEVEIRVKDGDRVLDSATGTGRISDWALQIAGQHEKLSITGIDINPRFFPVNPPSNVHFVVEPILSLPKQWTEKYDVVHQRFLSGGLSITDWKVALSEMHRALRPGGWVQLEELYARLWPAEATEQSLPHYHKVLEFASEMTAWRNIDLLAADKLPDLLKDVGFTEVAVRKDVLRLGPGEKYVGMRDNFIRMWKGVRFGMTASGYISKIGDDEFKSLLIELEKELEENDSGWELYVVCARRG